MRHLYTLFVALAVALAAKANVVSTSPAIVQRTSSPIVITFYANEGTGELANLPSTADVYAHTGVILAGSSQWSHAPKWLDNSEKYKLKYVSNNVWQLTIPSINEYYGTTSKDKVEKLAFVFRNASGSLQGKAAGGADIFVNVEPDGFAIELTSNAPSNIMTDPMTVDLTLNSTEPADLAIYLGSTASDPIATAKNSTVLETSYRIDEQGANDFIGVAVNSSGKSLTGKLSIFYADDSPEVDYPGGVPRMGPVANADGSVTFCLAAPEKWSALIVGSWNNFAITESQIMNMQNYEGYEYFWITIPKLNDGKDYMYYFVVNGDKSVGDPYARLVLDAGDDKYIPASVYPNLPAYPTAYVDNVPLAVYNSNMDNYKWKVKNFKGVDQSSLIVYELLIRDFTGQEGKANASGTIAGVWDKLDYIQSLGVNAIEFLPIMEFNGNNSWGYNTNFYFAPDKFYGTPNDYRALFDEIHRRGMAVILDIVFNQTDGKHPWYQLYPISENMFYNGSAPHSYSVLNDWNQDNPLVQQQFKDALKYWLTAYKVDGFRFDLVKGLGSNESYKAEYNASTNTWSDVTEAKTNAFNASRVARMKELHDAMREVNPNAYFINENLAGAKEENDMAKDGEINWANINEAACQFAMGYEADSDLNRFYAPRDNRTWGSTVSYAESHDEERMAYKISQWGVDGVKDNTEMSMRRLGSVAAQMLMAPGAHMIWQFQEFGADQTTKKSDGNDTSPKKVIWSYLDNPDRAGLKQNYTQLCYLRKNNPDMFAEEAETQIACGTSDWHKGRTITLTNGNKSLYLVVNPLVDKELSVPMTNAVAGVNYTLHSASYGTTPKLEGTSVRLAPGAYAVYGTPGINDVPEVEADAAFNVYVVGNHIAIDGVYDNVAAYDLAGRSVAIGEPLAQGIYIVKVDNHTCKVAVR